MQEILFYLILQFIYESKSERIIEVSLCRLAKVITEIKVAAIFMAHGVYRLYKVARDPTVGVYTTALP